MWGLGLPRFVSHSLEVWGHRDVCCCFLDEQDDSVIPEAGGKVPFCPVFFVKHAESSGETKE